MKSWTLITGASEGLGKELARVAAAEGRNLILTARSQDKLNALAEELRGTAGEIAVIPADLNDPDEVGMLWQQATQGRRIDILVNNAGLGRHGPFGDGGECAREDSSIAVNIAALTRLMKLAIPHMQGHGGGRVMNVASVAAFFPGANMAVYNATKAYVLSLSQAVAHEIRGSDVTITTVCPGTTATAFFDAADMHGVRILNLVPPMAADRVARSGWAAMQKGRRVFVPGLLNKLFAHGSRLAPQRLVIFLAGLLMGKHR